MPELAIIGGSGFTQLKDLKITRRQVVHTPFGAPSAVLTHGLFGGREVVFLPRHGPGHTIPPHQINYRANIWTLKHIGVSRIVGMGAVGGIHREMAPGCIAIPDQIIDYTWGRAHTYFEQNQKQVNHVDFTQPYCAELRTALIAAGEAAGVEPVPKGTYGATQGPRLESAMEINRMERDGCDIVGMTGMPEAALARELDLCYASCAVIANWAAGRGTGPISMKDIEFHLEQGMVKARKLLLELATAL